MLKEYLVQLTVKKFFTSFGHSSTLHCRLILVPRYIWFKWNGAAFHKLKFEFRLRGKNESIFESRLTHKLMAQHGQFRATSNIQAILSSAVPTLISQPSALSLVIHVRVRDCEPDIICMYIHRSQHRSQHSSYSWNLLCMLLFDFRFRKILRESSPKK